MATKRTPAEVLAEARRADSRIKRAAVFQVVDEMLRDGTEITAAAVARKANVSRWLVYADGVIEYVESAKAKQLAKSPGKPTGLIATEGSLRTDLELARQDNRRLRADVAKLKGVLRAGLGQKLEYESAESLRGRIDELVAANSHLQNQNRSLSDQVAVLTTQVEQTEDEVSGARESIRRLIRQLSETDSN